MNARKAIEAPNRINNLRGRLKHEVIVRIHEGGGGNGIKVRWVAQTSWQSPVIISSTAPLTAGCIVLAKGPAKLLIGARC